MKGFVGSGSSDPRMRCPPVLCCLRRRDEEMRTLLKAEDGVEAEEEEKAV
jgi:hypothetical protein